MIVSTRLTLTLTQGDEDLIVSRSDQGGGSLRHLDAPTSLDF